MSVAKRGGKKRVEKEQALQRKFGMKSLPNILFTVYSVHVLSSLYVLVWKTTLAVVHQEFCNHTFYFPL